MTGFFSKTKNQDLLTDHLKTMKPGDHLDLPGQSFKIYDNKKNQLILNSPTILCRERHLTPGSKKPKESGYRYEVYDQRKPLNNGAFGEVFLAAATLQLNEDHKIEILKKESGKQRVVKADFSDVKSYAENEALLGVDLPYLHMKPVIRGKDGRNYIVMRKIPGETLFELLDNGAISKLNENMKISLLLSLLEALQDLHQKGIIHRDIKPENIQVNIEPNGQELQLAIIDFGLSIREGDKKGIVFSGTTGFIAPEVLNTPPCRANDVFSLGKTFKNICSYGKIKNSAIKTLIKKMTLANPTERISLEDAINQVRSISLQAAADLKPKAVTPSPFFGKKPPANPALLANPDASLRLS